MKRMYLVFSLLLIGAVNSFAQLREIPKEVREQFSRQYPMATDVDFNDNLLNVNIEFTLDNEKWTAEYNNKGVWKHSEKKWTFEQLPEAVKDGFNKSKYADREVKAVIMLYYPGENIQYRIKTEKSAVEKKYLYFNPQGRLLRETITIPIRITSTARYTSVFPAIDIHHATGLKCIPIKVVENTVQGIR